MKLIIFDVDGTLIDSQTMIYDAMSHALSLTGQRAVTRDNVRSIIGLSLPNAVAQLVPDMTPDDVARVVAGYRAAFLQRRITQEAPLYPGALDCLNALAKRDDFLLGIATGKSRRGVDAMLDHFDLHGRFITIQTADGHPSKPHPAMLHQALSETGMDAAQAIMVGDTVFDIQMAQSAGIKGFGVDWGYHDADDLRQAGAHLMVDDFPQLTQAITDWAA